jgi:hypothetical protein
MHRPARHTLRLAAVAVLTLAVSGCGKTTAPTPIPVLATDTFTGTLAQLGKDSKTFTVNYTGDYSDASVTVNSLTTGGGTALSTTIGIAFGSIAFDTSCTPSSTLTATAATLGQEMRTPVAFYAGRYCVLIFDSGTLPEAVTYSLTVKHY